MMMIHNIKYDGKTVLKIRAFKNRVFKNDYKLQNVYKCIIRKNMWRTYLKV